MFVLKLETNIQLYSRINFTQTKKTEKYSAFLFSVLHVIIYLNLRISFLIERTILYPIKKPSTKFKLF